MSDIKYLDDERKKIWEEIIQINQQLISLTDSVNKKTSDFEHDAKESSRKASEYRNRCQKSYDTADEASKNIQLLFQELQDIRIESNGIIESISEHHTQIEDKLKNASNLEDKLNTINEILETTDEVSESANKIKSQLDVVEDVSEKISLTHNSILNKKKEIDKAYLEVFGYEEKQGDANEATKVNGLIDDLKISFNQLKNEISKIKKETELYKENSIIEYKSNFSSYRTEMSDQIKQWNQDHSEIQNKIKNLLPDALTAGLSHAFSEKRKSEIIEGNKLSKLFQHAIYGLVAVSIIPFAVDIALLINGKSLESVIYEMPRLAIAIMPLYIPFLWLAYSSNKKANLSKRLVEEYTHKEVLSKTFEGLSNQIENIEESNISKELKIKLLFNMLDASNENPGKLISDYNKADHPIIDALEKTTKLDDAIDKLSKIPGLSKLSEILKTKSEAIISEQSNKISSTLKSIVETEAKSE